jgi:hypothetical protein
MLRSLLAAALVLIPGPVTADWTQCSIINNAPIAPTFPKPPFSRQPDFAALYPKTFVYDGMPPLRMRGPAVVIVSTGSVAECGKPPKGFTFEACTDGIIIHTSNPCDFPEQEYARLLCHEIAHASWGWPADHGS